MRARDYIIERRHKGELSIPVGATDSREHAEIIAEAALEIIASPVTIVILHNARQVECYMK